MPNNGDPELPCGSDTAAAEQQRYVDDLLAIGRRVKAMPELDSRPIEQILYDEDGLPH